MPETFLCNRGGVNTRFTLYSLPTFKIGNFIQEPTGCYNLKRLFFNRCRASPFFLFLILNLNYAKCLFITLKIQLYPKNHSFVLEGWWVRCFCCWLVVVVVMLNSKSTFLFIYRIYIRLHKSL